MRKYINSGNNSHYLGQAAQCPSNIHNNISYAQQSQYIPSKINYKYINLSKINPRAKVPQHIKL